MDARHRTSPEVEYYQDTLEYNVGTASVPGFAFIIPIFGVTFLGLPIISRKNK
ncbi:MAG: hypothetical protein ACFFDW_11850 [Candidatus Thorarchaeota archaeon]